MARVSTRSHPTHVFRKGRLWLTERLSTDTYGEGTVEEGYTGDSFPHYGW